MLYAINRAMAHRGAVYLIQYKFPEDDKPRYKYCILMEDFIEGKRDLVVMFTTSHLEYRYKKSSVLVKDGNIKGITGDTLVECHNWKLIKPSILCENETTRYLSQLPPAVMKQIEEALTYVTNIDEVTLVRMLE